MLSARDLYFSYQHKAILEALSLEINKGECVSIVGENGCGKSTLLSILAGAIKPKSGQLLINGENPLARHKLFSKYTGYVPQENPLLPELTVLDNLLFWYSGSKKKLMEELDRDLLRDLGIKAYLRLPVRKLSGGMKRRVSIALALLEHPPLLLLDEPSASLDLIGKQDIRRFLEEYLRQGGTLLFTSHEEAELDLCHSLYVLKNGSLHKIAKDLRGKDFIKQLRGL